MKMGRQLVCMMIYTLHNCGGYPSMFFVFSFSFYRLTVEKDQMPEVDKLPHCFLPLNFWTDKGKVSTTTTCILCWLELAFFHKKFGWLREWRRSTVGLHDKGQLYLFLTFLFHM